MSDPVPNIAIIDYGLGNLRSVAGAVDRVGCNPIITRDPEEIQQARKIILPGVGAFGDGIENLRERELIEPLTELVVNEKKPILGICLGAHLLMEESQESNGVPGLGWVSGSVKSLRGLTDHRIPHVGWNEVIQTESSDLFSSIPDRTLFYFVHSYYIECELETSVIAECEYGSRFASTFIQENITGTQFHPEKSQLYGLQFLENYLLNIE